jgi:glycosyltransferase involved in cell wall biosynthesis
MIPFLIVNLMENSLKETQKPLVSVIMNCYNSSIYLKEAIESVLSQTYQNWEIIFWDNQSTDESAAIFKAYDDSRLKYCYAPEHTPLSTARNLAGQKAAGEIIGFLDCDDLWLPNKLEDQVAAFLSNKRVGIVYSDFSLILDSTDPSATRLYEAFSKMECEPHAAKNIYHKLLEANFIIFSSVSIRKDIYDQIGGFTDKFTHDEDYELLLKASLLSDAVCTNEKAIQYRIHGANNSYKNKEASFMENRIILNSLPSENAVKASIYRNEARYLIHNIIAYKKVSYLIKFLNLNMIQGLGGVVIHRARRLLFNNKAVR